LTHHNPKTYFSTFSADVGKKMDFRWEREGENKKGSVSLPRSIGESKPLLMFHSSLFLFYVFTFFFLCQVFLSSDAARKQKNADKQLSGQFKHLLFALDPRKKNSQPLAALHIPLEDVVSPTISQNSAPRAIKPRVPLILS